VQRIVILPWVNLRVLVLQNVTKEKRITFFPEALPFAEVIDYKRVLLVMSIARVTEMHFLIRSIPDTDLFFMRRQGRLLWQNYLGSTHAILSGLISLVRHRIGLPPAPMEDKASTQIFNETFRQSIYILIEFQYFSITLF